MLSTTLQEGLSEYGIGDKIRTLRLKKKMGLVELGTHTGLSPALLSKIERGLMFPTLPTLLRVALVFSVGLDFFFAGSRDKPLVAIVRKKDRVALPERAGTRDVAYRFESPSGASTPTWPSSSPSPTRRCGRTIIPVSSSFTP
jgi:transcriptional regulator with XRE-family HTH domain